MPVATILAALLLLNLSCLPAAFAQQANTYPWAKATERREDVASRIAVPKGFARIKTEPGSFGDWLRHLPLKPEGSPVLLFNGEKKSDQSVHAAVLDIDTGTRDLQQCADSVIRLRAEFLFSKGLFEQIHFNFTSGDTAAYGQWRAGFRAQVKGNRVSWVKSATPDVSYQAFASYLQTVFTYAGTESLSRELEARKDVAAMAIGDVFIHGGAPGHAVIVLDMAENQATGEKLFLIAQGYMPAQDMHLLKNPGAPALSPWYPITFGATLRTPEWEFKATELKAFKAGVSVSPGGR